MSSSNIEDLKASVSSEILNILVIRDHRPGHYNQSEGIVQAIKRSTNVNVQYLDLKRRRFVSWRFLYFLFNIQLFKDELFLKFAYMPFNLNSEPDIIISSGGETLLLNVILTKKFGCRNIFSGSIRNLNSLFFSMILTPYKRYDNIFPYVFGLKPSLIDPDIPPVSGKKYDFCFLVGGPSGTHSYSNSSWEKLVELIKRASEKYQIGVFASRRTPSNVESALRGLAPGNIDVFGAKDVDAAGLYEHCKACRWIVVTEDSNSMITEAVCSRKPVLAIGPPSNSMNPDEVGYIQYLIEKKWLARQCLSENFTLDQIIKKMDNLTPLEFNHLDILVNILEVRGIVPTTENISY